MTLFSPIVKKDIEVRSRGITLPIILTAVNAVLFLIGLMGTFGLIAGMQQSSETFYRGFLTVYVIVAMTEYIIILFIAPLFTAASISGERQTGTFDLLLTTRLTPAEIVTEKLLSAFLSLGMIIISCLPAMLLPLMFGGVSLTDTIMLLISFFPGAILMLSIGMFSSSVTYSVTKSFAIAYSLTFLITIGFLMLPILTRAFTGAESNGLAYLIVWDPLMQVASILSRQVGEEGFIRTVFSAMHLIPDEAFIGHTALISTVLQLAAAAGFIFLAILNVMPKRGKKDNFIR